MALISVLAGLGKAGDAVAQTADVLTGGKVAAARQESEAFVEVLEQYGREFAIARNGWFDRFVDGLNRLPRPALALGTMGLFAYSMVAPSQFALRMQGLALVPDPLWWLMGAIVSFYFGARELHYRRSDVAAGLPRTVPGIVDGGGTAAVAETGAEADHNAALAEWLVRR